MKTCKQCDKAKPESEFYNKSAGRLFGKCKLCYCAQRNAKRAAYGREDRAYEGHRTTCRKYGITPEQYAALATFQDNACAICKEPCASGNRLAIDHDHKTGDVRGLLCMACNTSLGKLKEDPAIFARAIDYLKGDYPCASLQILKPMDS